MPHLITIAAPTSGRTLALLTVALMLSGCAGGLGGDQKAASQLLSEPPRDGTAQAQAQGGEEKQPQTELEKATAYWGKEFAKNPRNLDASLAYAKNLKAMGQKTQALAVLQQASLYHASDRKLNSEYGRLALELDQLSVAQPLLAAADDATNPDWRVVLARGTLLAKQGKYKDAIPFYERALTLAQDHPSIVNNLAMAYAMGGEADKAEGLLRKALAADAGNAKVRQNLAIVLGLQGKHDEARGVAAEGLPAEYAAHNTELLRKVVRAAPAPAAPAAIQQAAAPAAAKQGTAPAAVKQAAAPASARKAVAQDLKPAAADPSNGPATPPRIADADGNPLLKPSAR